jgi:type II secretion system protein G
VKSLLIKLLNKNSKGFTLIELLIVVAIIGIIAAIAVPSLLSAIQRSKQKRSMADMRSIGTALETYQIDYNKYPQSGEANLVTLQPNYMRTVPTLDGWRNIFKYVTPSSQQDYSLGSGGRDASNPTSSFGSGTATTTTFDDDIVFFDGQFTRYPEGVQT